ncbi:hypothetical protein ORI20_30810 [Mycobacterium sp. CVI_P3]|uniref:Uncharacterized protein n=1 Tax=Mycobacterium pinniadriaticum TaxID=2994102 RepID=A0ABT3SNJ8_9MYCO|nr:hypothetical protein [Mycobacterium pinniadriaticum]MCX2934664.1 hypothetical protein [Mycobacterium pinniadriaticum]MCX2941086.1 hypothetical protein [Mycobacterium pinniadriaticum]
MIDADSFFQFENLDSAIAEYEHATLAAGRHVSELLGITVSSSGSAANTLNELRRQIAPRLRHRDSDVGVITTPGFDAETDIFASPGPAAARFALRSAIRLTHSLGFTSQAEIAVGEMAVAAIRAAGGSTSHLAYRIAEADHIESVRAALTLGRPVRVQRNFVVRCAVFGLGEALNAEHDADEPASTAIETWLAEQRAFRRHQR